MAALAVICVLMAASRVASAWGPAGHEIVTRAALAACDDLPRWFTEAAPALAALSNAPDRWRDLDTDVPALAARRAEHYFDLDVWGRAALPADRWAYARRAIARGLDVAHVGALPFAIAEQYGALVSAFRDARADRPGGRADALVTAGHLAHFAGDAVVPLHATRHHHGWRGPNPRGFTRRGEIHAWFEGTLVTGIDAADVRPGPDARQTMRSVPVAVRAALEDSLALVPELYEAERRSAAGDDAPARALVRRRLVAGATLLASLWHTAWVRSAP